MHHHSTGLTCPMTGPRMSPVVAVALSCLISPLIAVTNAIPLATHIEEDHPTAVAGSGNDANLGTCPVYGHGQPLCGCMIDKVCQAAFNNTEMVCVECHPCTKHEGTKAKGCKLKPGPRPGR